ncbi:hypothetical protein GTA08_BOTSDO13750 [Botryosphaeria dothidea]|uniref:Wax synthase domain-containing protein n=1 Tax=Botryosphaeria dothidea TaxID=55169 RepID=A0A8H4J103_9PEZI|nr:hypothetical protein GTA08_BOTSDO13750 [Botryosphaeria dothidea]
MIGLTAFSTMWWYAASRWAGDGSFMMGPMFAFPITLRWAFMVLRGTPELDCVQLQTTQAGKKTPVQLGLLQKLKWSMDLWCSWRGIGWNWEIQNIRKPANSSPSRLHFVLTNLVHIAVNLAAAQLLTRFFFCPLYPSHANTAPAFLALPLWRQHAISTAQLALSTRFLDTTYRVFATCAVLLGLSPPAANPACFGSLADAWSVRTFWGRTWHQTFRAVFVAVGDAVAGAARARKGTRASRHLKTHAGFATSGAMHALPGLFVRHAGAPWWTVTNLLHMPLYAVVVTVEDGVKGVGRRLGVRDSLGVRLVGYAWTAFWVPFVYRYAFVFYIDIGFCDGVCAVAPA